MENIDYLMKNWRAWGVKYVKTLFVTCGKLLSIKVLNLSTYTHLYVKFSTLPKSPPVVNQFVAGGLKKWRTKI